jgi:hypothetical protein
MTKNPTLFRHKACGSELPVQETWLRSYLSDPYDRAEIVCDQCLEVFPASEFTWSKTGETLDATSRRLRAEMPNNAKLLRFAAGTLLGLILGGLIGGVVALLGVVKGHPAGVVVAALVLGGAAGWYFLNPLIYRALHNAGVVTWKGRL